MAPKKGTDNSYPQGQCTWWADNRFHEVTGVYVPWMGDAHSWSGLAPLYGWQVSSSPTNSPCIICLQPLVQLAGPLGHVGFVESIIDSTTVVASNQNWGLTRADQLSVRNITFHTGPGVAFISLSGAPVQSTKDLLTNYVNTQSNGALDFSFLATPISQLAPLGAWLGNPNRMLKMVVGIILLAVAVVALLKPDVGDVAKLALLA